LIVDGKRAIWTYGCQFMPTSRINGVSIHYEVDGRGDPLLFVHGLGGCLDNWSNQAQAFSKKRRVIRLDLRGFGKSECPPFDEAYSVAIFANDLLGLVDLLGLQAIHLVGTSMGGYVSQRFTLSHPERVRSLVLCHTTCRRNVPPEILHTRLRTLEKADMRSYARLVVSQALAEGSPQELVDTLIESVSRNSKDAYIRVISKALVGFDLCEELHSISAPTLIVAGEKDQVIPPDRSVELQSRIPGSRLAIIRNVGHLSYLERPEEFNAILQGFLRDLPA
jgi:pimeloyl-ACP methyl ester carboxylesterase